MKNKQMDKLFKSSDKAFLLKLVELDFKPEIYTDDKTKEKFIGWSIK